MQICRDFKVTINQASKLESYPIPKIEDLLASLSGGQTFSKIDLKSSIPTNSVGRRVQECGCYQYAESFFPLQSPPFWSAISICYFQRTMELLQGILHMVIYLNDILVAGQAPEEYLLALEQVLSRLEKAGL